MSDAYCYDCAKVTSGFCQRHATRTFTLGEVTLGEVTPDDVRSDVAGLILGMRAENDRLRARVAELEASLATELEFDADCLRATKDNAKTAIEKRDARIDTLERDLATARSDKLIAETARKEADASREAAEAKIVELRGIVAALTRWAEEDRELAAIAIAMDGEK